MYLLSTLICSLTSIAISSSEVNTPFSLVSNSLKMFLRTSSSVFLFAKSSNLWRMVLVRCLIYSLVTVSPSSSHMPQTDSIMATKYSSLGRLMDKSV